MPFRLVWLKDIFALLRLSKHLRGNQFYFCRVYEKEKPAGRLFGETCSHPVPRDKLYFGDTFYGD